MVKYKNIHISGKYIKETVRNWRGKISIFLARNVFQIFMIKQHINSFKRSNTKNKCMKKPGSTA